MVDRAMSVLRAIPIQIHTAIEVVAAPLLIVAPFALGFDYLAGALSIALGVALIGLALSVYGDDQRGNRVSLTAHAGLDYSLAAITIAAGVVAAIVGDFVATVFLVGFGSAHLALTASTRFSRPLGA
jgi:hypothetical protein